MSIACENRAAFRYPRRKTLGFHTLERFYAMQIVWRV
jgi:hypothetical protein